MKLYLRLKVTDLYLIDVFFTQKFTHVGKRLADPVNPSNVAVSQKLSDMYDPDCCQKPYGTQFVSYILTLSGDHVDDCDVGISGQMVFVGFDSGKIPLVFNIY